MPEKIEERRLFTHEERTQILKSTKGICAHCGKKLTTKTMTIEHIIPIMRGGTNDIENLTALCSECNTMKDNLIYLPRSFYLALVGTGQLRNMEARVREWYQTYMTEELDIQVYPMIAPINQMMIALSSATKHVKYNRSLILQWSLAGREQYEETEAITGLNLHTIRRLIHRPIEDHMTEDEVLSYFKNCKTDEDYERIGKKLDKLTKKPRRSMPVPIYTLRKLTSDKLFALTAVRYDKNKKDAVIYFPWADMTNKGKPQVLYTFMSQLLYAITEIAEYDLNDYMLLSPYENAFDYIKYDIQTRRSIYGRNFQEFKMIDKTDPENITYGIRIHKFPQTPKKKIQDYINIPKWIDIDHNII